MSRPGAARSVVIVLATGALLLTALLGPVVVGFVIGMLAAPKPAPRVIEFQRWSSPALHSASQGPPSAPPR